MKTRKVIEIWVVQNDTGKLITRLVKNSQKPKEFIAKRIAGFEGSSNHLVATNFNDYRYEKYHS